MNQSPLKTITMDTLIHKIWSSPLTSDALPEGKLLINTLNANSINVCRKDPDFNNALLKSDILLPDGVGAIIAGRILGGLKLIKISGYDLFIFEMEQLNKSGGKCFFLGSSENVLSLIKVRSGIEYSNVKTGFLSYQTSITMT